MNDPSYLPSQTEQSHTQQWPGRATKIWPSTYPKCQKAQFYTQPDSNGHPQYCSSMTIGSFNLNNSYYKPDKNLENYTYSKSSSSPTGEQWSQYQFGTSTFSGCEGGPTGAYDTFSTYLNNLPADANATACLQPYKQTLKDWGLCEASPYTLIGQRLNSASSVASIVEARDNLTHFMATAQSVCGSDWVGSGGSVPAPHSPTGGNGVSPLSPSTNEPKSSDTLKLIVGVILLCVLLVGAGYFAWRRWGSTLSSKTPSVRKIPNVRKTPSRLSWF